MRSESTNYLLAAFVLIIAFSLFGLLSEKIEEINNRTEKITGAASEQTLSAPSTASIDRIIAVSLSPAFDPPEGISFGPVTILPSMDEEANGNNPTGITLYEISIDPASTNTDVDFCIKASGDLIGPISTILLDGYTWTNNTRTFAGFMPLGPTNPPGPADSAQLVPADTYMVSQLAVPHSSAVPPEENAIYYRFYLDVPDVGPGTYTNTISFKALATTDPFSGCGI